MPRKSIPISTRISPEDAEFLASWNGSDAATPSEKLRGMISELRRQKEGAKDYSGALHVATALIGPTLHAIRTSEHETAVHSELVTRLAEWLPECLAFLIAASGTRDQLDREALIEIEEGLADRAMTLKLAAQDRAEAVRTSAEAEAEKLRIEAEGEADAELRKAEAAAKRYEVEAAGTDAMNRAANVLSEEQIAMQLRMALIKYLPDIIRESVKPMEKIDGIKIIQVDGLTGAGQGGAAHGTTPGNMADQLVASALRYRAQSPLVDSLLAEIGLNGGDLNGLTRPVVSNGDGASGSKSLAATGAPEAGVDAKASRGD